MNLYTSVVPSLCASIINVYIHKLSDAIGRVLSSATLGTDLLVFHKVYKTQKTRERCDVRAGSGQGRGAVRMLILDLAGTTLLMGNCFTYL